MTENGELIEAQQPNREARIGGFIARLGGAASLAGISLFSAQNVVLENHFGISVDNWVSPSLIYGGLATVVAGLAVGFHGIYREDHSPD